MLNLRDLAIFLEEFRTYDRPTADAILRALKAGDPVAKAKTYSMEYRNQLIGFLDSVWTYISDENVDRDYVRSIMDGLVELPREEK